MRTIAIIGGGASGALAAAHLLVRAQAPLNIVVFDRGNDFGRGLAFGAARPWHLLNVRAASMSAWPADPHHLLRWLDATAQPAESHAFIPRETFGRYLQSVLEDARAGAAPGVTMQSIGKAVNGLRRNHRAMTITYGEGEELTADDVILALGNFPPRVPGDLAAPAHNPERLVVDPWAPGSVLCAAPEERILVIGTGLTMVDVVMNLQRHGHTGEIIAISRRGLLSGAHRELPDSSTLSFDTDVSSVDSLRGLLRIVRRRMETARENGIDWREVIDALRPYSIPFWRRLSMEDRRRFIRHLRPYWDISRHRTAPQPGEEIARLRGEGRLKLLAGRIKGIVWDVNAGMVEVQPRGSGEVVHLAVHRVINCSGPDTDFSRSADPLVRDMLQRGLMTLDPALSCPLADDQQRALTASGQAEQHIRLIGPLLRSRDWEAIAVPEIRDHAARLAELLLDEPDGAD